MSNPSEYQVESGAKIGLGDGGFEATGGKTGGANKPKSLEVQPVGGRMQERARQAAVAQDAGGPFFDFGLEDQNLYLRSTRERRSAHTDYNVPPHVEVSVVKIVSPQWHDPRWSDARRADTSTLYEPSDRDPPNRTNYYVYRSTRIDALDTPVKPLAVPDVHKLRYMSNNYTCPDDWY